jgi:predicted acyl esterase
MIVQEARIPVRDGTELAATLYLPPGAVSQPVPALLEYLPYRKDDAMLARDHDLYGYMTAHGYAGARVDIRGTGASGGDLPEGEYTEQEQRDAEDVIAWLAAQPWCDGAVGMWGISWGGFNAIQVALRRPPALRAIIAVDASDDLFHDDVHYIDGLLHLDEYALMIDHLNALPPAPGYPLDPAVLASRFDREPWLVTWLAQQRDGPYWRRASLRPGYQRLTVPAFLIGGWYDGYRDSVPRMLAAVPAPVKVLIGPWNHTFPHNAVPGPAIEWRAEAVRWWDHWLKGASNGIMTEPPVTVYVRHWHPPDPALAEVPGHWRTENAFPPERTDYQTWYCGPERDLLPDPPPAGSAALRYVPSCGVEAGHWWGELTVDQRGADAFSLVFDSPPLPAEVEILGFPVAELHGGADAEPLHWFCRLCDVAPDGTSTLVTGAGSAHPGPVELHVTSWVFPRGHRIRLALSNAMWPMIWPTPHPATATVRLGPGATRLVLPVVPPVPGGGEVAGGGVAAGGGEVAVAGGGVAAGGGGAAVPGGGAAAGGGEVAVPGGEVAAGGGEAIAGGSPGGPDRGPPAPAFPAPAFPAPAPAEQPPGVRHWGEILPVRWSVERDGDGGTEVRWRGSSGTEFGWGRVSDEEYLRYRVHDAHPAHASAHGEARTEIHAGGRVLILTSVLDLASDSGVLDYRFRRELRRDGILIRHRDWHRRYPRDGH